MNRLLVLVLLLTSLFFVSCATINTGNPDILEQLPESPIRPAY